jgi:hypothetical protein
MLATDAIDEYHKLFELEKNIYVKSALTALIAQRNDDANREFILRLVLHPNEKIQSIGKLFRCIKNDYRIADEKLKYIFHKDVPWRLCDNMSYLHIIKNTGKIDILDNLIQYIKEPKYHTVIGGLRPILMSINRHAKASKKIIDTGL